VCFQKVAEYKNKEGFKRILLCFLSINNWDIFKKPPL